ncbi:DNA-processing protein DprA [Pedobacter agri]|uniref:DNA-processing protein DprA n=1 Tax=Pedobacter agri TaxID=454586 RepID=UPI002931AC40|nr:DNA-processing protein DprA [Pedobacter agri]
MVISTEIIVRLLQIKGLGRRTAFKLCKGLDFNPTPTELIEYLFDYAKRFPNTRLPVLNTIEIDAAFKKAEDIIDKSERADVQIISYYNELYPQSLKEIPDPPLVLNIKGNPKLLSEKVGIAIIGTREPSDAGRKAGVYFSSRLAENGFNIVSGLAKGCDAAAHEGCLLSKGTTTGILAHGLQTIYPKENRKLAEDILENNGLLLTEYLFGTGALSNYFVERDRLQAGLSKATIVIQTGEKGGTMHAVRSTLESNKKLAAVKYNNNELANEKTRGNEKLINDGKAFALTSSNLIEFVGSFSAYKSSKTDNFTPKPTSQLKIF